MEDCLKKYGIFFLLLILIMAAFFRFYQLKTLPPGLYPDEAMNGNNALEAIKTGDYKIFYPENNGREGLFMNIQSLSVRIFGNEPWALRLVSGIFGILTVLGLYLLAKELFKSEFIALSASFFLAASFWHINFSRIGFRAIMAPFFLVWGFWLLWKLLRSLASKWKQGFFAILAGVVLGLGFYSYISYRLVPFLCLIPLWTLLKNKKFLAIILFVLGTVIAVLPLLNYFYHNPADFLGRTSQISVFSSKTPVVDFLKNTVLTLGMFFVKGDFNWRHNFAGAPELWWPVAILFLIGIILSFKKIFKREHLFLAAWFIIMLLPVVISNEGIPHALRSIVAVPVAMILAALGLDWLIKKINIWLDIRNWLKISLFIVFLIAVCITTYTQYFIKWGKSYQTADAFSQNYSQLGNYLKYSSPEIKKYIVINADGTDVRGYPMPSQTVMFLTDTFLSDRQKQKNIYYILPKNLDNFIKTAKNEQNFQIFMLEIDSKLRQKLNDSIPGLFTYENAGILIQQK